MRFSFVSVLVISALILAACPSYTRLNHGNRETLKDERVSRIYYLTHSMYVGDFYDDDRVQLMHERRFDHIQALQNLEGKIVFPPRAKDILPIGTKVLVSALKFPTQENVIRRPLYTPRYSTWVELKIITPTGLIDRDRIKAHYILIPSFVKNKEAFDAWFDKTLSDTDPSEWLKNVDSHIRRAVLEKRVVKDMDHRSLVAAFGSPDKRDVFNEKVEGNQVVLEIMQWGDDQTVWMTDGKVTKIVEREGLASPLPLRR